jgi:hypothetical protein
VEIHDMTARGGTAHNQKDTAMGCLTDAKVAAWQEEVGILPARGAKADLLNRLSGAAYILIMLIERERSGIRDGDGYWHGCDVMGEHARDVADLCAELARAMAPTAVSTTHQEPLPEIDF